MKQGWTYKKLGDLYPIIMGKTPPRGIARFWDTKKETHNLWVSIADLSKNEGKEIKDTKEYISNEAIGNITKIAKGSLLVSFKLTLGKMAFAGDDLYTNEAIMSLGKRDDLSLKFLYYYFSSLDWGKIAGGSEKVKGKTLNKKSLSDIPIAYIPLSEQQRIVERLDSAFAHIDELKANAEKQVNEARALFQKALSKAMEPKEGWEEKVFTDICDVVTDFVAAGSFADLRKNVVYKELPDYAQLVRTTDLKHRFENKSFVYVNEHAFKYLYRVNLDEESIILPNVGVNCGEVYYLHPEMLPYKNNVLGPNAIMVRSHKYNNQFLSYLFLAKEMQVQLTHITSSMAQPKFNKTNLKTIRLHLPPLSEQQRIVERLDSLSANVKALEENQRKVMAECDALKQALLRKVFE